MTSQASGNEHVRAEAAEAIDALLPQTQCTRCGYPTCRDYADAIAGGEADIDRCPPGGAAGVAALADLLGCATKPLNAAFGVEAAPTVALIDEAVCIGCTKCIQACPVDAIVGAGKRMHTVIAAECTGCELCLPPCPVDCIAIVPVAERPLSRAGVLARAARARRRLEARTARLARSKPSPSTRGSRGDDVARSDGVHEHHPPPNLPLEGEGFEAGADARPSPSGTGSDEDGVARRGDTHEHRPAPKRSLEEGFEANAPITRSAVLAAIARGRARKRGETP